MPSSRLSIRHPALVVFTFTIAAACSCTAAATTGPTQAPALQTIVVLGDSLTSGHGLASPGDAYPARLEEMLRTTGLPFRVVNHGVAGDTTTGVVRRLGAALDENPAILIVALGANDGLRGVPIATIRSNLATIIQTAQARNVVVLLCGMETLPLHGFEYMAQFHYLFPALAEQFNVPLVPFLLEGIVANPEMLQTDYIHPNAAGALQMARTIWPYLHPLAVRVANALSALSR